MKAKRLLAVLSSAAMALAAYGTPVLAEEEASPEVTLYGKVTDAGQCVTAMTIDYGQTVEADTVSADTYTVTYSTSVAYGTPYSLADDATLPIVGVSVEGSVVTVEFQDCVATSLSWLAEGRNYPNTFEFNVTQNSSITIETRDGTEIQTQPELTCNVTSYADLKDAEVDQFEAVTDEINYQIHVSDDADNHKLIVWFHGNGEGDFEEEDGTIVKATGNNCAQILANRGGVAWVSDEAKAVFGDATVVAFQAPSVWYYATKDDGALLKQAKAEIDAIVEEYDIDPSEIYVSGCSAGGFFTTRMLIAYPNFFKAAMINCPALDAAYIRSGKMEDACPTDEELESLKDSSTAIWLVQGETDSSVNPDYCSKRIFNILTENRTVVESEHEGTDGIASAYTTYETTDDKYKLSLYETTDLADVEGLSGETRQGGKLLFSEDYNKDGVQEQTKYSDHWSWIYTLRDNPADEAGEHIWEWANSYTETATATGTQKLHIEGDDWGPGVDKTVITLDTEVAASDLDPANFTVTETKEATDWTSADFSATIATSERTVLDVYLSDEEGNPVNAAKGNIITVEMYISPSEGSPFRYVMTTGYNKWCDPYELAVEGTVGNITVDSNVAFDLTDDTQWFNEKAQSFDVDNTYTDSNGYTYVYGEYTPEEDDHKNALVIWLHGAGEGQASNVEEFQNDNYIDILGNEVTAYVSDEFQDLFDGAYVITPQAPTMWMDVDGNGTYNTYTEGQPSVYSEGLFELIEDYVANNPDVDPNRIIIGGCSNGGYMTMRMVIDHPDYFYKAFPIAEAMLDTNISDEQIQAVVDGGTGIWFTYADTDTTVDPTVNEQPTVERLMNAGANVHVTEWAKVEDLTGRFYQEDEVTPYEYSGHWSWIYFDNNDDTCDLHEENEWEWLASTDDSAVYGTQKLHIEGDDWGPGVDKTIITLKTNVAAADLDPENFTVTEAKEATDWANNPYAACISTSERTILDVYLSDEEGNVIDAAEGNIITVEMYISPSEGSPFRYVLQSGYNKWCDPYELAVAGTVGDTTVYADTLFDLTDDTQWYNDAAHSYDVTNTYTDSNGYTYVYGEYTPAEDDEKNALIIWLHGAGEGQASNVEEFQNDNYIDILGNEVTAYVSDEFQDTFDGAYVITPQAPTMWMDYTGNGDYNTAIEGQPSVYSEGLFELIEDYVANNPDVDANRIIIGGCSNGGYMTMRMVIDHPDYFYKAFPICEAMLDTNISDEQIQALAESHTGIWFTYADTDTTVDPTANAQPTIERMKAAGVDVHVTEWEKTEDITGRFYQEDEVTPYEYSGHWSWIYFDNNANTCDLHEDENEWVYLAAYTSVTVNGEVINKKYYTVDENGKPVLTSAYIATLNPGEYKMVVNFNGTEKNYKFTIEAKADGSKEAVDTGDTFNAGILGGTMAACAALIAAAWFALKNRK